MNIPAYLERIQYQGSLTPTAETLRQLQMAHLLTVPFENLSIHARQPIILEDAALFTKIVERRRGGFCYEVNGLFAALLRALGFNVAMLSAGVKRKDGTFGPPFDHMTLLVTLDERWLVDVGFGDSFLEPLRLDLRDAQVQGDRAYRIDTDGTQFTLMQLEHPEAGWLPQYRFTDRVYTYSDYADMCQYHQTSAQSSFPRQRICSRATPEGRVTLSDMRLITTRHGVREERLVESEAEYAALLHRHFGIAAL
jgi:N-hydroxyarylamine O-acetyltransferase